MEENQYQEAKKLFLDYAGNTYFMYREGDLDRYNSYEVPYELEHEWMGGYIRSRIDELKKETVIRRMEYLSSVIAESVGAYGTGPETLSFLYEYWMENEEKFDTFINIRMGENMNIGICRYKEKFGNDDMVQQMEDEIRQYLKELLQKDVYLSEETLEHPVMSVYDPSPDRLKKRINNLLDKFGIKH